MPDNQQIMKKFLMAMTALMILVLGPWYGSRQAISAMEQQQETGDLQINLAYWAGVLPGFQYLVNVPRTLLAVSWHQYRSGAEFADAQQLAQRTGRLWDKLEPWLQAAPTSPDGSINPTPLQARQQILAAWARADWSGSRNADASRVASELSQVMQSPAAAVLPAMQRAQTAESLALHAARQQDAALAARWILVAEQALPAPADGSLKAMTAENTARHLLRLRTMLASCNPGKPALLVPEAEAELRTGYDVRQLRQQYTAGPDHALVLHAQQAGNPPECLRIASQYRQLLTAAQP